MEKEEESLLKKFREERKKNASEKITIQTLIGLRTELIALNNLPNMVTNSGQVISYEGVVGIGEVIGYRINKNIDLLTSVLRVYDKYRSDYIEKNGKVNENGSKQIVGADEVVKFVKYLQPIVEEVEEIPKAIRKLDINNKKQLGWSKNIPSSLYQNLQKHEIVVEDMKEC